MDLSVYKNDRELAALHKLAVLLAPELTHSGLRLMRQPAGWPAHSSTAAYSITGRCLPMRDELRRRGEWPGFWGCGYIVFVDKPTIGLTIHEAAHILPNAVPLEDMEPSAEQALAQVAAADKWENRDRSLDLWSGHEAPFIRRCLHLHARAWQFGVEIGLPEIQFAGDQYCLSPAWRYADALGDEPERFRQLSFCTIESLPAPAEFTALFKSDVEHYNATQKDTATCLA